MAWIEPEVSPGASRIVLHDLDLVASLDSQGLPIKKKYPNNLQKPDNLNVLEKIRFLRPIPGDVITVNVTGRLISTTATQPYSLVASGPFVSAAWYCQDPRFGRKDLTWRTEYCGLSCTGGYKKQPLCCETLGGRRGSSFRDGTTCIPSLANASKCSGLPPPQECGPTRHRREPSKEPPVEVAEPSERSHPRNILRRGKVPHRRHCFRIRLHPSLETLQP